MALLESRIRQRASLRNSFRSPESQLEPSRLYPEKAIAITHQSPQQSFEPIVGQAFLAESWTSNLTTLPPKDGRELARHQILFKILVLEKSSLTSLPRKSPEKL